MPVLELALVEQRYMSVLELALAASGMKLAKAGSARRAALVFASAAPNCATARPCAGQSPCLSAYGLTAPQPVHFQYVKPGVSELPAVVLSMSQYTRRRSKDLVAAMYTVM